MSLEQNKTEQKPERERKTAWRRARRHTQPQAGRGRHYGGRPAGGPDINISLLLWCCVKTLVIAAAEATDRLCQHSPPSSQSLKTNETICGEDAGRRGMGLEGVFRQNGSCSLCSGRVPGPSGWSWGQAKGTLED